VAFSRRYAPWIVAAAVALAAASATLVPRIRVNSALPALLPQDTPAKRALDELNERVPSSAPFLLLVRSSDPELNKNLARALADRLGEWPEIRRAFYRRDPSYFLDRRLLYLPAGTLEELAGDVEQSVEWHRCEAHPLCVNLEDRPEPPNQAELEADLEADPEVSALLSIAGIELGDLNASNEGPESSAAPDELGYLCNEDGSTCAVEAIVNGRASDLGFASRMLAKGEALLADVRPDDAPDDLRMVVSGRYRNAPMIQRIVVDDLRRAGLLSTLFVLLILLVQFRGLRAFALLWGPLLVGASWTLGAIALVHPTLNIISASTLAILVGLGSDFGVHLLTHYGRVRATGLAPVEAMASTFSSLRSSMLVAGVTTACGFGALAAARFRGFAEMGVLVPLAIIITWMAFVLVLPALAFLLDRAVAERSSLLRQLPGLGGRLQVPPGALVVGGLVLCTALGIVGRDLGFEYNFRKLDPKSVQSGIRAGGAVHGTQRRAIVVLGEDRAEVEAVAASVRAEGAGDLTRDDAPWVIAPSSFVPAEQERKLAALSRLRAAADKVLENAEDDEDRKRVEALRALTAIDEPITAAALPEWVRQRWLERNGDFGRFALVYTDVSGSDARDLGRLADHVDGWRDRYPDVRFASPDALLGTIVPALAADGPLVIGLALLGLCAGIIFVGRSASRTLIVLVPLVIAMVASLGVLVLAGVKINLYNLLIFPVAFGIGLDGAIYIAWAAMSHPPGSSEGELHLQSSRRAVVASTLTTLAAFGSLATATLPGLATLGVAAIVTLGATMVVNVWWLPALLRWRRFARLLA